MKKQKIKKIVLLTGLCGTLFLGSTSYAMVGENVLKSAPIQVTMEKPSNHWAAPYVNALEKEISLDVFFEKGELNEVMNLEDLNTFIQKTLGVDAEGLETNTREAVVAQLVEIWADQTGTSLDEMAIPMMLVYSDTTEIDRDYQQKVMIGYFQKIAQGRPDGLFHPKDLVTYGEAATLIHNVKSAVEEENKSEQTKEAADLKVDVDYEVNDDGVNFHMELNNMGEEPREIQFSSGQQYEIRITNEQGEEVYRYSADKFFTLALLMKNLEPGESLQWDEQWDRTNKEGIKLTEGSYTATIEILGSINDQELDLAKDIDFEL